MAIELSCTRAVLDPRKRRLRLDATKQRGNRRPIRRAFTDVMKLDDTSRIDQHIAAQLVNVAAR